MEVDPEIACGIVGNIGQLWLQEQLIDLQINIDDCEFHCNRFILCACSGFLSVLLQSEVTGEAAHHVRQLNIKGISPGIFQLVLNAIYKGENGLNTENIIEFWHAVHELQIPVLVSKCETFISSHMTRENVLGIYTSALLLKSKMIVKIVHEFMAENFEYFSKCQVFMLLSSKTLHQILSGRNLKVDKQYNLPESILKWVSHARCGNTVGQSCAGDILEVRDTNIVSDRKLDHSTDVNNGHKGSVEVILQKPPASSQDSCLQIVAQFLTETPAARKASLGSLLKLCQLSEVSRDCLEMLADTDMIMSVKETRDMVRQALEAHSKAQEFVKNKVLPPKSSAPANDLFFKTEQVDYVVVSGFERTEQVVVFQKGNQMYAYSLDRKKFFDVMPHLSFCFVLNYNTLNNCIFITEKINNEIKMTLYKFPFSQKSITVFKDVGSCSVIVGGFCYTFKDNGVYRKRCDAEGYRWFQVIDFKRTINCVIVEIFKDNIIFYDIESDKGRLRCLNTTTLRFWDIMTFGGMCNFVTFIHNAQLFVLTNKGHLWNMTANIDPTITNNCDVDIKHHQRVLIDYDDYHPTFVNKMPISCDFDYHPSARNRVSRNYRKEYDATFELTGTPVQKKLWDGSYNLLCAVVYTDKLMILADLNSCQTPVIKKKILIPGLSSIHFTHLATESKCYPLIVPSTMLITEV